MRPDKKLAIALRRQHKSYTDIGKKLGIPKSTLATWFRHDPFSAKVKEILAHRAQENSRQRIKKLVAFNKVRWEQWREEAREEARKKFALLVENPLFSVGLALYWAEGDNKAGSPFRLTNTDPRMIALYAKFLVEAINIPRENLRPAIVLYPDLCEKECLVFWSKIIGVPEKQFYKTQFIKGRHPTKRLSRGICMITCGNRQLKEKVLVWIDLLSRKLIQ